MHIKENLGSNRRTRRSGPTLPSMEEITENQAHQEMETDSDKRLEWASTIINNMHKDSKSNMERLIEAHAATYKDFAHSLEGRQRQIESKAINEMEYKDDMFTSQIMVEIEKPDLIESLQANIESLQGIVNCKIIEPLKLHQQYGRRTFWDYFRESRLQVDHLMSQLETESIKKLREALIAQNDYYMTKFTWMRALAREREDLLTKRLTEEFRSKYDALNDLYQMKCKEAEEQKGANRVLVNTVSNCTLEVEHQKAIANRAVREKESLYDEVKQWTKENSKRLAELEELSDKYRKTLFDLQETKRALVSAKNDIIVAEESSNRLKTSINTVNANAARLEKALGEEKEKVQESRSEVQNLKVQINQLEASKTADSESVVKLMREVLESKQKISDLEATVKSLTRKLEGSEEENKIFSKRIKKLEIDLHEQNTKYRTLDQKFMEEQMTKIAGVKALEMCEKSLQELSNTKSAMKVAEDMEPSAREFILLGLKAKLRNVLLHEEMPAVVVVGDDNEDESPIGGDGAKKESSSNVERVKEAAKVRQLIEKEIRLRLEKDIEKDMKQEFLDKYATNLRAQVKREMNKTFTIKLNNALQVEKLKSKKTDNEWREIAEKSEAQLRVMQEACKCGVFTDDGVTVDEMKSQLKLVQEAQEEVLLALQEKEMLLAEMTLRLRDSKVELDDAKKRICNLEESQRTNKMATDINSMLRLRSQVVVAPQANMNRRSSNLGIRGRPMSAGVQEEAKKGGGKSSSMIALPNMMDDQDDTRLRSLSNGDDYAQGQGQVSSMMMTNNQTSSTTRPLTAPHRASRTSMDGLEGAIPRGIRSTLRDSYINDSSSISYGATAVREIQRRRSQIM